MMADTREILSQVLKQSDQTLIAFDNAKFSGVLNIKTQKIAVVTDQAFGIYSKTGKRKKSCFWVQISHFSFDNSTITLKFGKNSFILEPTNIQPFLLAIFDTLQRVLTSSELTQLGFYKLHTFVSWPTALTIKSRILQKIALSTLNIDPQVLNKLFRTFTFGKPVLNLNKFPVMLIPLILDALPLSRDVRDLIIKTKPELDAYELLAKYMSEANRTRRIEIQGPVNSNFDNFLNSIQSNVYRKLQTLSFDSAVLEEPNLMALAHLTKKATLKGLEFHDAFSSNSAEYFYSSFFDSNLQISILNLDRTPHIDIIRLFRNISNPDLRVTVLSLANCGLDLSITIPKLTILRKVKAINLSGNRCSDPLPLKTAKLPPNLTNLEINNVKFERGCLAHFFNFQLLKLSCANANLQPDEWPIFYSELLGCTNQLLTSFTWDGNPCDKNLFEFLSKNTSLQILSMNDCLSFQAREIITAFCEFIQRKACPLRVLFLRGTIRNYASTNITNIIKTIAQNYKLEILDVSGHQGGEKPLQCLCQYSSRFDTIVCDESNPMTMEWIAHTYNNTDKSGVLFSFPGKDVQNIMSRENWSEANRDKFYDKCSVPPLKTRKQPPNNLVQPPNKSEYDDPCRIFKYYKRDGEFTFPHYFYKQTVDIVGGPLPLPVTYAALQKKQLKQEIKYEKHARAAQERDFSKLPPSQLQSQQKEIKLTIPPKAIIGDDSSPKPNKEQQSAKPQIDFNTLDERHRKKYHKQRRRQLEQEEEKQVKIIVSEQRRQQYWDERNRKEGMRKWELEQKQEEAKRKQDELERIQANIQKKASTPTTERGEKQVSPQRRNRSVSSSKPQSLISDDHDNILTKERRPLKAQNKININNSISSSRTNSHHQAPSKRSKNSSSQIENEDSTNKIASNRSPRNASPRNLEENDSDSLDQFAKKNKSPSSKKSSTSSEFEVVASKNPKAVNRKMPKSRNRRPKHPLQLSSSTSESARKSQYSKSGTQSGAEKRSSSLRRRS